MNKILFADLDGTLLDDNKKISEKNREAIQKLLEQGDYFVICTGRPVASGRIVARELGLTTPGCYMICFNGGVLYDCSSDRTIFQASIPFPEVSRLFEEAQKEGIHIQTYNETDIIALEHSKELDFYKSRTNMNYKIVPNIFDALTEEPQKVLLVDMENSGALEAFKEKHAHWTEEGLNAFFSCKEYLEYCPKDVDKGFGLSKLVKFLNVPIENTYAVGDERNDISMIKTAGVGIAMRNAVPEVKEAADYVTEKNNNEDAMVEIIEKFFVD